MGGGGVKLSLAVFHVAQMHLGRCVNASLTYHSNSHYSDYRMSNRTDRRILKQS